MNVNQYLKRIHYSGPLEPSFSTLQMLHRQHILTIPYENLDIHLGKKLELDLDHIFNKIVLDKRGGWCYEMNGLFAWVLRELGFDVTLLSGAVNRDAMGANAEGNHLVLLVKLEQDYIADVGFGDLPMVIPLREGSFQYDFLTMRLGKLGERWVFYNHEFGGAKGFDFTLQPYQLSDFVVQCERLQTSPNSGFVQKTVCQRFLANGLVTLRGAVLSIVTNQGIEKQVVDSREEYKKVLYENFGLEFDSDDLFARVWQRHLEWLASGGKV